MSITPATFLGALALELRPGAHAERDALETAAAGQLAGQVAHDLHQLVPAVADFDLALLAAHYDPVELLRPGWPLHAAIAALVERAPGLSPRPSSPDAQREAPMAASRILAFGARDGVLPAAVPAPESDYAQGALRLVPFLLRGAADAGQRMAEVASALEETLFDRGMVGAATALYAQEAFAAPLEHARYASIHDLAVLMAMQYEHAGLTALWPLIETALLAPGAESWLDAAPEPLARYAHGEVRIALLDADGWRAGGFAPAALGADAGKLERAFAQFEARQRQFAAILGAHAIAVRFDHCPPASDPRATLRDA
ncbi:MAG: hypothetical protein JSS44_05715 [Proteobacteria bacterium]|nr:hypothetical protein [Pseudomonadota bacterium]MBS0464069.1 hypothetical protein [Pseudomonadota bacterium]